MEELPDIMQSKAYFYPELSKPSSKISVFCKNYAVRLFKTHYVFVLMFLSQGLTLLHETLLHITFMPLIH